jgi:hypothetical protein
MIGCMRVRNTATRSAVVAVVLPVMAAVPGCGGDAPGSARRDPPPPAPGSLAADTLAGAASAIPPDPRADTMLDTLLIEGMPEPVAMALVRAPAGFGLPFSTFLPPGLAVEFEAGGDGAAVRFLAAFGGSPARSAYLHVRLYPPGTTREDAMNAALVLAGAAAGPASPTEPPFWGLDARTFSVPGSGSITGRIVIARHGDRLLHVVTHYPAEYGDGLSPRFATILHHWRWEDTGRMLAGAR